LFLSHREVVVVKTSGETNRWTGNKRLCSGPAAPAGTPTPLRPAVNKTMALARWPARRHPPLPLPAAGVVERTKKCGGRWRVKRPTGIYYVRIFSWPETTTTRCCMYASVGQGGTRTPGCFCGFLINLPQQLAPQPMDNAGFAFVIIGPIRAQSNHLSNVQWFV
jgi:hypothetical protein